VEVLGRVGVLEDEMKKRKCPQIDVTPEWCNNHYRTCALAHYRICQAHRKCNCGYEKFHTNFSRRLHSALKPAVKMWQKETGRPLTWPDTVSLVKWMAKKLK
jgi:hypothetical protein